MSKIDVAVTAATLNKRGVPSVVGRDNFLSIVESSSGPCMLVFSLWAVAFYSDGSLHPPYLILSVLVFALTFPGESHLGSSIGRAIVDIVINWVWIAGLLLLTGFATGYVREFSEDILKTWLWVAPLTEVGAHLGLRVAAPWLLSLQGPPQKAIIVGMNEQGTELASRLRDAPYSHVELLGFVDSRSADRLSKSASHKLIGKIDQLSEIVKKNHVQVIYLSLPMASQPRILQLLDNLKDTTASIYFVPDMFFTDLIQGHTSTVCGLPVISVCETPFRGANGFIKRASDITLSLLILTLISPILIALAVAVKVTSPGPIIFKQRRYGLDGEEILVYKFRSMTVTEDGEKSYTQVVRGDSRVTPLGAFIRKTSLDELPQFINVLQGRMSIVGPRPHAVAVNENYRKLIQGYMVRHKVKPGITGWAQVNGYRGGDDLEHMKKRIEFDLDYLRHWSLRLDLHIIFRTVRLVVKDAQAH